MSVLFPVGIKGRGFIRDFDVINKLRNDFLLPELVDKWIYFGYFNERFYFLGAEPNHIFEREKDVTLKISHWFFQAGTHVRKRPIFERVMYLTSFYTGIRLKCLSEKSRDGSLNRIFSFC